MNLINSKARVLFENKIKNENKYFGRDEYFNSVIVESDRDVTGKILEVKINQCNRNTLFGEVILNKNYRENAA
jgi:tRNA A37 methylthiotransferase MiaB